MILTDLRADISEYVKDKTWYWYVLAWLFGLYLFFKLLDFRLGENSPSFFISIAQSLDFFLHEMAHLMTGFLPSVLTAAAGSFSELLLGTTLIVTAFLTRSYFASLFCFLWFMLTTQATADYMADARSQNLPLVSFGGGDPVHDWHFVFGKLGLLEHDTLIAGLIRGSGIVLAVFALIFSASLIVRIMGAKQDAQKQLRQKELEEKHASTPMASNLADSFSGGDLYPTAQKGVLAEHKVSQKDKQIH